MALFDQTDFTGRLLRLLPAGWFPAAAPRLNAVLQGAASSLSAAFAMLQFVKAQMRVPTASGAFLDLISQGYFAGALPRLPYEQDAAFAKRIEYNLTAPRGTHDGMAQMLTQLTGNAPTIYQPNSVADGFCLASIAQPDVAGSGGGLVQASAYNAPYGGFGAAGAPACWGSLLMPCQVMILVSPPVTGLAVYSGYPCLIQWGGGLGREGGYLGTIAAPGNGSGALPLVYPDALPGEVTDAAIYQQIYDWMPVGYSAWTMLSTQRTY